MPTNSGFPATGVSPCGSALEVIPTALDSFTVPVTNLVGAPALRGAGVDRLLWRDGRSQEQLNQVGIYAQPTGDAVHRGDPDIKVAQGNHFVSLESKGEPDPAHELEVLHLPWRSWSQYERRVINTGRSYEANPTLRPSKNHHGMADYRRHLAGRLWYAFLLRLPLERDLVEGDAGDAFVHDTWLRDHLHALVDSARLPDLLARSVDAAHDEPLDPAEHERDANVGSLLIALERERDEALMPLPLRDDWKRLAKRTVRILRRRAVRAVKRRTIAPLRRRLRGYRDTR